MKEVHRIGIFEGEERLLCSFLVSKSCVYFLHMLKPKNYGSGWFKRFNILVFVAFFGQFLKAFLELEGHISEDFKDFRFLNAQIFSFFFFLF